MLLISTFYVNSQRIRKRQAEEFTDFDDPLYDDLIPDDEFGFGAENEYNLFLDSVECVKPKSPHQSRWPSSEISYYLEEESFGAEYEAQLQRVKNVIKTINEETCLKLIIDKEVRNYKKAGLYISFDPKKRKSGTPKGYNPEEPTATIIFTQKIFRPKTDGTIWACFLKVLGVCAGFMENMRSDRDNYIDINYDNFRSDVPCLLQYKLSDLDKPKYHLTDEYDVMSLCHFFSFDPTPNRRFSRKSKDPLMTVKNESVNIKVVGRRDLLEVSPLDLKKINALYGCEAGCKNDEFQCANKKTCIKTDQKCNGVFNCPDSSDEPDTCPQQCPAGKFACSTETRKCIPDSWKCDGYKDCLGGDDEARENCFSCGANTYECKPGPSGEKYCVAKEKLCDLREDCPLKDDESNCNIPSIQSAEDCQKQGGFPCNSKNRFTCLPEFGVCNLISDCDNGEDEVKCDYRLDTFPENGKLKNLCESRGDVYCQSIHSGFVCLERAPNSKFLCDGTPHCTKNEDEIACAPVPPIAQTNFSDAGRRPDLVTPTYPIGPQPTYPNVPQPTYPGQFPPVRPPVIPPVRPTPQHGSYPQPQVPGGWPAVQQQGGWQVPLAPSPVSVQYLLINGQAVPVIIPFGQWSTYNRPFSSPVCGSYQCLGQLYLDDVTPRGQEVLCHIPRESISRPKAARFDAKRFVELNSVDRRGQSELPCTFAVFGSPTLNIENSDISFSQEEIDTFQILVQGKRNESSFALKKGVFISVGERTLGAKDALRTIAVSSEKARKFAKNVVSKARLWKADGIIIDWLQPNKFELGVYMDLLREFMSAVQKEPTRPTNATRLMLGVYVSADLVDGVDPKEISNRVDYIITLPVKSQEEYGWLEHENYFFPDHIWNIEPYETEITNWLNASFEGDFSYNVFVGLQIGARSYRKSSFDFGTTAQSPADGMGPQTALTNTPGKLSYAEACKMVTAPASEKVVHSEMELNQPYAWIPPKGKKPGLWFSYENEESIANKVKSYFKYRYRPSVSENDKATYSNHFAGLAIVDVTLDDITGYCGGAEYPLLRKIMKTMRRYSSE